MYYSAHQPPPTISELSSASSSQNFEPVIKQQKRRLYIFITLAAVVILGGGVWWYGKIQAVIYSPQIEAAKPSPKPTTAANPQVAGVTFGDLLKKQRNYAGWLAGVDNGKVVIMNPQSGELNSLTSVDSQWFGPISNLVWSPDKSKLAYLVIPPAEAQAFNQNPQAQAHKMGLSSVPTPQTFPFGRVTILDVNTKQQKIINLEARNTPKSIVWLDDNRLAAITTGLSVYNLLEDKATAVAVAGVTDGNGQLQSPLIWNASTESIFFTKVKKDQQHGTRVAMQVNLKTNSIKELTTLSAGNFEDITISRSVDMALDNAGERLAFINEAGVAYLNLADGGVHSLPPQDDWLWLKDSILSDIEWLSPSKITFTSLARDGSKVWVVWDIPASKLSTFGKGSDYGSWGQGSERLALLNIKDKKVNILTPNWDDPLKSSLEGYDLPWQRIIW